MTPYFPSSFSRFTLVSRRFLAFSGPVFWPGPIVLQRTFGNAQDSRGVAHAVCPDSFFNNRVAETAKLGPLG
jgi:hypothetical protein